jgi:hypothetical protein
MRLNEISNQAKFTLDIGLDGVEMLVALRNIGGQDSQVLQVNRNTANGAGVSNQQFFVSGENKVLGGIAGPENLSGNIFKKSFDFAGVTNGGFTGRQPIGGAKDKDAAADKQADGNAESCPRDTTKGKSHNQITVAITAGRRRN